MKRLVEINAAVNYGSTGRIAEAIGLVAQREGWECTMVHGPRYVNPSQLPCICTQGKWGDRMHGVRSLLLDGHGLGSKRATERLVRRLDALQPDVVHLHNVHGYYLNYEVLFRWLQRADCKVVWTLHDCWPFTGHCTYFDFIGCDRWKSGCHDCPQLRAYPRSLFVDRTSRNYELKRELFTSLGDRLTLVPVSHWLEELVKESFFKGTAVQTIYNGIDTNVFRPRGNKPARDYVLGVASPWCERKGFNDFIALRSELPADVDIVLVGLTRKQVEALPDGIVGIERTQNVDQLADNVIELLRTDECDYSQAMGFFEENFSYASVVSKWEELLSAGRLVLNSGLVHPFYRFKWLKYCLNKIKSAIPLFRGLPMMERILVFVERLFRGRVTYIDT